uniref:Uncharacterized protein n=1 Tax=Cacopsylla melanoneura TaxID=428564 RepID=A0A8D8W5R8_9HEMI
MTMGASSSQEKMISGVKKFYRPEVTHDVRKTLQVAENKGGDARTRITWTTPSSVMMCVLYLWSRTVNFVSEQLSTSIAHNGRRLCLVQGRYVTAATDNEQLMIVDPR